MNGAFLDLGLVVARLKGQCNQLRHVAGVAAYRALTAPPPRHLLPAAYVVPMHSRGGSNVRSVGVLQPVAETFGVLLCLGAPADHTGGEAVDDLKAPRDQVGAALLGWQPSQSGSAWDEIVFVDGRLVDVQPGGVLWWQDSYATSDHLSD